MRPFFLFGIPALLAGLLFCGGIQARAESSAREALAGSIDRILAIIKEPDYANPATRPPLSRKIELEARRAFDFAEFSMRTAGARWRQFSPQQKEAFSEAFAELLLATYIGKITGYNGEQVQYTGEQASPKGDRAEIRTLLTMKDGKKIPVAYRMLPKGGGWRVYDVLIENVSLVKNYRTQFQSILNSASPDELISRIRSKAQEARQQDGNKK